MNPNLPPRDSDSAVVNGPDSSAAEQHNESSLADVPETEPIAAGAGADARAADDELPIHEYAQYLPALPPAEYATFKDNIAQHGQHDPILLHEGQIADGVHRYRACRELGIEPRFVEWDGEGSLLEAVLDRNLHRRHLTESQRAILAARLEPHFAPTAKENQRRGGKGQANLPDLSARTQAAKLTRVSPRLVTSAAQVLKGIPDLVAAVERGDVKVSAAAAVAALKKTEQEKLVTAGPRAVRARAAEMRRAQGTRQRRPATPASTSPEPAPRPQDPVQLDTRPTQDLPDSEWVKSFPIRDLLKDPTLFDREALLYRRFAPVMEQVRGEFPDIEEGPFPWSFEASHPTTPRLITLLELDPPSKWRVCKRCNGAGRPEFTNRCRICSGYGFQANPLFKPVVSNDVKEGGDSTSKAER